MNLYGWDLLYATKLSVINEKFKASAVSLPSNFNYQVYDDLLQATVAIAGKFGTWTLAANKSNKLIWLTIPVSNCSISGLGQNVSAAGFTIVVELNLSFISSAASEKLMTLNFDFSGNGTDLGAGKLSIVDFKDISGQMSAIQRSYVQQAIVNCLQRNPGKLNYAFASVMLKNEQADWLSPDTIAFSMASLENGDDYFCVFGCMGQNTGQLIQIDPTLFNHNDDMYLGLSAAIFMQRILLPGYQRSMNGAALSYANSIITISNYQIPGTQNGLLTYYPVINTMQVSITGNQLITTITGSCDMYFGVSMRFSRSSAATIHINLQARTIDVQPAVAPSFSHTVDIGGFNTNALPLVSLPVSSIASAIAGAIANNLSASIDNNIITTVPSISPQSIRWTNTDFASISQGGLMQNFFISGRAR